MSADVERGTCAHCGQPITRHPQFQYLPDSKGWSHDREPEPGSFWCDPDRVSTDSTEQPHAEPAGSRSNPT